MSTVVHLVEFFIMSLVGIMFYKLYLSYKNWKHSTTFLAPSDSFTVTKESLGTSSDLIKSDAMFVKTVQRVESQANLNLGAGRDFNSSESLSSKLGKENKSSIILNDYIGEFFSESQVMSLPASNTDEAKRALSTVENFSEPELTPGLAVSVQDAKIEDEVIKVGSSSHELSEATDTKVFEELCASAEVIPTLNEFSDLDTDSFITVASVKDDVKNSDKVMSDKVVMAMLDEAKLVCAS